MIALLIRCYPARWRARYGDEFEALLHERPLGPFDVADVLLGALDARLHPRGPGAAFEYGRGTPMTLRIGGYAALLGGILWFVVLAGNAINDGAETFAAWLGLSALSATVATLVALVGLSAFQARRDPRLAWTAFVIPATGAIISLLGWIAMATGDSDRQIVGELSAWALMSFGLFGLLVGSALFAIAALRAGSLSQPAAALLLVGAVLVVPALAGLGADLHPILSSIFLMAIGAFPTGWAALGLSALRVDHPGGMPLGGAAA